MQNYNFGINFVLTMATNALSLLHRLLRLTITFVLVYSIKLILVKAGLVMLALI